MALYAISDLHLCLSADKPMHVFGNKWQNYMERLAEQWRQLVTDDDCVILNGDISWATYLDNAYADFAYLDALPGHKLISKGNHDYWWTTKQKLYDFVARHGFTRMTFLQNDVYMYRDIAICATRGWQSTADDDTDARMYNRETIRLEMALKDAVSRDYARLLVALHYPPNEKFIALMNAYTVNDCIFGHLHSKGGAYAVERGGDIRYTFVSADYLGFKPRLLYE